MLLACWGWEQPVQVVSGDVRDASSPSTKEDLGWDGSGQGGGLLAKEWSVVLGRVCWAPHVGIQV